jgi:hypothetical protein
MTDKGIMEYLTCWTESRNVLHPTADPHRRLIIRSHKGNPLCRLCGFPLVLTSDDCESCLDIFSLEEYRRVLTEK